MLDIVTLKAEIERCRAIGWEHYVSQNTILELIAEVEHSRAKYDKLIRAVERFLEVYQDVSMEHYFGDALDSAFSDNLQPLYAAVQEAQEDNEG